MMNIPRIFCNTVIVLCLLLSFFPASVSAALIPCNEYSLTSIVNSYAWGCTDWNAVSTLGYVDNVADRGDVETLLCDGYVFEPSGCSTPNGIYNWEPDGLHALEFTFNGGTDYMLNSLSFISSRSYENDTPISIEYAINGSGWIVAVSTTSGALGITTGNANTYTINLGGIIADRVRFVTNGGEQVSVHEISIDGERQGVLAVPAMSEWGMIIFMLLAGTAAVYYLKRHRSV